jgi:hypothetical protein
VLPDSFWSLSSITSNERDQLIAFWLASPLDQLETLWHLEFGIKTKQLVLELSRDHIFSENQKSLRNAIGNHFNEYGLSHERSAQLLIVNFLLSPPGLLTINNVEQFFPHWLASSYSELYVSDNFLQSSSPVKSSNTPASLDTSIPSPPDFGSFPSSLQALSSNRIHLNRLLGLSNLYFIDPEDRDIYSELAIVRTSLAKSIDSSDEADLEQFWQTDLGDRYWALVRSGLQRELLSDEDKAIKQTAVSKLNPDIQDCGFGSPGALKAFIIAMMYFEPGTMQVPDAQSKIPNWIFPNYHQIFESSISTP